MLSVYIPIHVEEMMQETMTFLSLAELDQRLERNLACITKLLSKTV